MMSSTAIFFGYLMFEYAIPRSNLVVQARLSPRGRTHKPTSYHKDRKFSVTARSMVTDNDTVIQY